jgi:hypothetical protein
MDFIFSLGSFSIYFKILKINFNNNYLKNVNCFLCFTQMLVKNLYLGGLTYHEAFLKVKSPFGSKEIGVDAIHHLMP